MGVGAIIGGISAISGLAQGVLGSNAASNAAEKQSQSAQAGIDAQLKMFGIEQQNLQPYMQFGQQQMGQLSARMPGLTAAFNPTQQSLEATPGYQFTLGQGEKAVTNGMSAQGLGGQSGALGKGLADYATGLASNTFGQRQNEYWQNNQNAYNMLAGGTQIGANAAAGVGNAAIQTGQGVAGSLNQQGQAQASGILGSAQSLNSGFGNATGGITQALLYQQLYGQNSNNSVVGQANSMFGGNLTQQDYNNVYGNATPYQ